MTATTVPDSVRDRIVEQLWGIADEICWVNLSNSAKSKHYDIWTEDPEIGAVLARYMDIRQVRVYLKDTLLKPYSRARMADESRPLRVLDIAPDAPSMVSFIKPHGRLLEDGRLVCWGRADDWKSVLMALHERSFTNGVAEMHAAVLCQATGRYGEWLTRRMVEDAARKLGVRKVVWLDS